MAIPAGQGAGASGALPPSLPPISSIHIPSEEQTWLSDMAASGSLDGVPAVFLAIIDQAESSGDGGGINSEGYGGYFGLGTAQAGASTLEGTSQAAFDAQAALAAQDFAQQLNRYGDNPVEAEQAYQQGSYTPSKPLGEGAKLFEGYGIGSTNSGAVLNTAGSNKPQGSGGPVDLLNVAGAVGGSIWNFFTGTGAGSETQVYAQGLSTAERDALAVFGGWTSFLKTMLLAAFFALAALIVLYVLVSKAGVSLPIPV